MKQDMNKLINYFSVQVRSAQHEVEQLNNVVETLKEFLFSFSNGVTCLVNDIIHDASAHSPVEMMQRSNEIPIHSAVLNFFDRATNSLRVRVECQLQTSLPLDKSGNTTRANVSGKVKKNAITQLLSSEQEVKSAIKLHAVNNSNVGKESEQLKPNNLLQVSASDSKNSENYTNTYSEKNKEKKNKNDKKKSVISRSETLTDNTCTTSQTYNASAGLEY